MQAPVLVGLYWCSLLVPMKSHNTQTKKTYKDIWNKIMFMHFDVIMIEKDVRTKKAIVL